MGEAKLIAAGAHGSRVESRDPFTGELVHAGPAAGPAEVRAAVAAARAGAQRWARTPVEHRAAILRAFADRLDERAAELADALVREVGKRRADADGEVAWTALSARWYADHPPTEETAGDARVLRRPLGVIAAVTPWNVPLVTPAWKWLPALIAGNAVVWKPSERATGIAEATLALLRESGLPDDALVLVAGDGAAARALAAEPDVAAVHFTGSEAAGRALAELAAPRFARCALEMSGLNPAVVLPDADLDLAADCIVACGAALAGQKCTATRRVLVCAEVHDALVDRLAARIARLRVGDPRDPDTDVGPLICADAARRARAEVERAVGAGARVLGAAPPPPAERDTLFSPVLLGGLAAGDPLRREELFAPVIAVEAVPDAAAAVAAANATAYGLSAAVYGLEPGAVAQALEAGVVAINRRGDDVDLEAPFGGWRHSGNGLPEGGAYVYAALTELQAVYGS